MHTHYKFPLSTKTEQHRSLVDWNRAKTDRAQGQCIHQLFEAQVTQTPDAVAVIFPSFTGNRPPATAEQLTYAELNRRANQLAHYLQTLGVGPEVLVGLCAERSLEMVIGVLAVLKAGGAYVPLDPSYPQERLAFILTDTGGEVLLTQPHLAERLPDYTGRIVFLDQDFSAFSTSNPTSTVNPENGAFVLYTSGSTGQPKGVVGLHRVAVNRLLYEPYPIRSDEVFCQKTSLNFIDAIWEIFVPLVRGLPTLLIPEQILTDPTLLARTLDEYGVTRLVFVPSLLRFLLNSDLDLQESFPTLKYWGSSGEPLPVNLARQFAAALPKATLVNLYGTSEVWDATWHPFDPATDQNRVPIGQPLTNVDIYILDRHLQQVSASVPGELYIGGEGLARGYHNRPELTAEKFIPHPFSRKPGARLYKTGDMARYQPDGTVEFLGRIDHQVKVRGFRIELGEIEAVLDQHPAVQETVVLAWDVEPGSGEKRLAAYFVPKQQPSPTIGELRTFLEKKLPDHMVPFVFIPLEALPLTPNGKIDRRALPPPDVARPEMASAYVAPRTPTEEVLADIWADVLGIEQIGAYDNFFELGGHSLLAGQLISRIRKILQTELPLDSIFETPTVAGLAEKLIGLTTSPPQPITPVDKTGSLPLSFAQQRLWFLDQLESNNVAYNLPLALRLSGQFNRHALERALNDLIDRHQSLRTTFITDMGQPAQLIHPAQPVKVRVLDLRHLPAAQYDIETQRLATEEIQRPFDLSTGPLLHVTLLQLGDAEHLLLLVMHHIISDGWSMAIFSQELATLYNAYAVGSSANLPDLPAQYSDFAVWQREWLQGEVLESQLAYWKEQLKGQLPMLQLPTDRPRPPMQTFRGATHFFVIPRPLTEALQKLSQEEEVTLFMTLLAAFKVLLYRYTSQTDILVGSPIANRNRSETEGLIGFLVNTLVLRTDLSGNPTFQALLRQIRRMTLAAYTHQDLPFEKLVEELQPERDLSRSPLFQVMFSLDHSPLGPMQLQALTLSPVAIERGVAQFDLNLLLEQNEQGLLGSLEYNTDLFDEATIIRLANHFQILLAGISANREQRLLDLPLLTKAERKQLLVEWNDTKTGYPDQECIHELFEAQVTRTPEAIAVVFEDEQLTYQELNRRANQLAHHLQAIGVGPETLVGICVERSLEMLVGLIGILKAGGAYVPLDPAYPAERIAFILEDAQVSVLLTQEQVRPRLPDCQAHFIHLDKDWQSIAEENCVENPAAGLTTSNLAYVIYTSGSTGQPKGVQVLHRALTNFLSAMRYQPGLTSQDVLLAVTTLSFDIAALELFLPLTVGARLAVVSREVAANGPLLLEQLADCGATVMQATPATWQLLLAASWQEASGLTVLCGGEALPRTLANQLLDEGATLWNLYGPTETTIWSAVYQVDPGEGSVPIGRPIANTQIYLLDARLQPVAVGLPGELYIGGHGLARGYLNRPDLTAESFIPDPFSHEPGGRLYKTGDLARYLPGGSIEFLGRIDHQVKIRGYRIELEEIEVVLSQHPNVDRAVVLACDEGQTPGSRRLVAYIVPYAKGNGRGAQNGMTAPSPDPRFLIPDLRHFLQAKLPDYMIPPVFVFLDTLPLTPNGKVYRRALPAPDLVRPELEAAFVAPHTQTETVLASIWAELLDIKPVGIHDNFFELGGNSILSIQVIAQANQAGLQLTPRELFQHQTIAELAEVASPIPVVRAEQGPVTGPVPLTPIQHWFFEQQLPAPHHWNQSILLEVQRPLEVAKLEQVVQYLLEYHDALRLRFEHTATGWQQFNAAPGQAVPFSHADLSALPPDAQREAITKKATELQTSLNLSEGPLLHIALFDLGPQQSNRLLIVAHHLVIDGESWRILLADMQTAYQQLSRGDTIQLPPKTISFKQWAQQLTRYAQSATFESEPACWLSRPWTRVSSLPVDYPEGRNANSEASARTVSVSFNIEDTKALLYEVHTAYRTQLNDLLLTALTQAFARWRGETDTWASPLLIDLVDHDRAKMMTEVDLSRTVGQFTFVFPVLLSLEQTTEPGEALKSIKERLRRIPKQGSGFGLLRYLHEAADIAPTGPESQKLSVLPQAEVIFNYLGQFDQVLPGSFLFEPAHESSGPDHYPDGPRAYVLEIDSRIMAGQLQLNWTYSENVHRRATIEKLAQEFIKALQTLITHCQSPEAGGYTPSDFPEADLSQVELDDLLAKLSD